LASGVVPGMGGPRLGDWALPPAPVWRLPARLPRRLADHSPPAPSPVCVGQLAAGFVVPLVRLRAGGGCAAGQGVLGARASDWYMAPYQLDRLGTRGFRTERRA
jgi:hypothetical protein